MARQSEFERSAVMKPIVIRELSEIDSAQPLSIEATRDSVLVHAFHTFPEHLAVVKTQSLLELV